MTGMFGLLHGERMRDQLWDCVERYEWVRVRVRVRVRARVTVRVGLRGAV